MIGASAVVASGASVADVTGGLAFLCFACSVATSFGVAWADKRGNGFAVLVLLWLTILGLATTLRLLRVMGGAS